MAEEDNWNYYIPTYGVGAAYKQSHEGSGQKKKPVGFSPPKTKIEIGRVYKARGK